MSFIIFNINDAQVTAVIGIHTEFNITILFWMIKFQTKKCNNDTYRPVN